MSNAPRQISRPRSGPHRDLSAREAVLHAADDLLAEHGFATLTIEAIARKAGVSKQTVYRWWKSKVDILLEGLIEGAEKQLSIPSDAAPTLDQLADYLRRVAKFVTSTDDGEVFLALIAHAQHDGATASMLAEQFLLPRRERERGLIARAVLAGTVPQGIDADGLFDAFLGPIVFRRMTGGNVSEEFVERLLAAAVHR